MDIIHTVLHKFPKVLTGVSCTLAGEKPYQCNYCPKSFYLLDNYQYHVRQHTGKKPHHCDVCGKAFSYSHNLNELKNKLKGHRPYR